MKLFIPFFKKRKLGEDF